MISTSAEEAVAALSSASQGLVFTGAGISVESGIPPFRGDTGLWNRYDPGVLDLSYFHKNPRDAWQVIREIFYDVMKIAAPNAAHSGVAELEEAGHVTSVVTQNIDGLHQAAGSRCVHEFHGTCHAVVCTGCGRRIAADESLFEALPPGCDVCGRLLKPAFTFFGEQIDPEVLAASHEAAAHADVVMVIGTAGAVMPAAGVPVRAKFPNRGVGATVIEINPERTAYTENITDIFLAGPAGEIMADLLEKMDL